MATLLRVTGVVALCLCGAAARAQFAPPGGSGDAGGSAASPGAAGGNSATPNLRPPAEAPQPDAGGGPLAVVRANQTMTANAMIGVINAEPIFLNDLFRPIDADLRRLAATCKTRGEFERKARALIGNQLLERQLEIQRVAAAEAKMTEQDKARIDAWLALERSRLIADHGGSVPAAERALAAEGSSVDQEMTALRRRFLQETYIQKNLRPHMLVTRQMLLDAYERDPGKWEQPAQVELYTITLAVTKWLREPSGTGTPGPMITDPTPDQIKTAEAQALAQGRRIVEQLKAGADFAVLAEDNESVDGLRSVGGRVGLISRGSIANKQKEDYVFALPANSLGEPLLLREADFHNSAVVVAKVGKKTEARTISFSEAQGQIANDLLLAQQREWQRQDREKLDRGAAIEAVDRMGEVAVEGAVTRYALQ
jgi:hypothetical protein